MELINEYYIWTSWIDETIVKRSKKPFKGGAHSVQILELVINEHSKKLAFKVSDGTTESVVDCFQCILKEKKNG